MLQQSRDYISSSSSLQNYHGGQQAYVNPATLFGIFTDRLERAYKHIKYGLEMVTAKRNGLQVTITADTHKNKKQKLPGKAVHVLATVTPHSQSHKVAAASQCPRSLTYPASY